MNQAKALLLIADDEDMNKLILARRLRKEGFETIDVADGSEAVEKIRELALEQLPSVVLMDINMPVMDGIEATRILKQEFQNLPIIAVTATRLDSVECERYGFDGLCTKPIDFKELVGTIKRFLDA